MKKMLTVEYEDGLFIDIETESSDIDIALGPIDFIDNIKKEVFDDSLNKMVSFIKSTGKKVREGFCNADVEDVCISMGITLGGEGKFFVANASAEANLTLSVTFKTANRDV